MDGTFTFDDVITKNRVHCIGVAQAFAEDAALESDCRISSLEFHGMYENSDKMSEVCRGLACKDNEQLMEQILYIQQTLDEFSSCAACTTDEDFHEWTIELCCALFGSHGSYTSDFETESITSSSSVPGNGRPPG